MIASDNRVENKGMGFAWAIAAPLIMSGVTTAIGMLLGRQSGAQKVAATLVVDEIEVLLKRNLAAFGDSDKSLAVKNQALANFDALWAEVIKGCGDPALGNAGRNCISERKAGGQWDWFRRYRDPIANTVVVESNISSPYGGVNVAGVGIDFSLLIGIGIVGIALYLGSK